MIHFEFTMKKNERKYRHLLLPSRNKKTRAFVVLLLLLTGVNLFAGAQKKKNKI